MISSGGSDVSVRTHRLSLNGCRLLADLAAQRGRITLAGGIGVVPRPVRYVSAERQGEPTEGCSGDSLGSAPATRVRRSKAEHVSVIHGLNYYMVL